MNRQPVRNKDINWRQYKKASLLDSGLALNSTATFIMGFCNGQHTVDEIISEVVNYYKINIQDATRDVTEVLQQLINHDVIQWKES